MSDDHKRDLHTYIEPELEARIAALVLGEASDFERDELERLMDERPELRVFRRRLEEVHGLLQDAVKPQDDSRWRLPEDRRADLMAKLGIDPEPEEEVVPLAGAEDRREARIRRQGVRVAVMAAACLMISLLLAPFFMTAARKEAAAGFAGMESKGEDERLFRQAALEQPVADALDMRFEHDNGELPEVGQFKTDGEQSKATATLEALRSNLDRAGRAEELGSVDDYGDGWGWLAEKPAPAGAPQPEAASGPVSGETLMEGIDLEDGAAVGGGGGGYGGVPVTRPPAPTAAPVPKGAPKDVADKPVAEQERGRREAAKKNAEEAMKEARLTEADPFAGPAKDKAPDEPVRSNPALPADQAEAVNEVRRGLYTGEGYYNLGKFDEAMDEYERVLEVDPYNAAARRQMERIAAERSDYYRAAYDETRAKLLAEVDQAWEEAVPPVAGKPGAAQQGGQGQDASENVSGIFPVTPATPVAPADEAAPGLFPTEYDPPELPNSVGAGDPTGLRSGDAAVSRNSIDAILNAPERPAEQAGQDAEVTDEALAKEMFSVNGGLLAEPTAEDDSLYFSRGTTRKGDQADRDAGAKEGQEEMQQELADAPMELNKQARPGDERVAGEKAEALSATLSEVEELDELKRVKEPASAVRGLQVQDGKRAAQNRDEGGAAIAGALESHDYAEAERDYRNAQAMLQAMKLQHSTKRIGLKIPKEPVTIHEEPEVAKTSGGFLGLGGGTYEGEATLQINPNTPDLDPFGGQVGEPGQGGQLNRQFFQTEFEVILGEATLRETVEDLDLDGRWKTDEEGAVKKLRELVSAEQVKGTDLLSVRVKSKDKAEAKAITEKVVENYRERRTALEVARAEAALEALDEELREQEALVEEKRKVLDTIVQAVGIPYVESERVDGETGADLELQKQKEAEAERAAELREMEKHTSDEAFSTFSLHVSDVSFKLAQAALEQGAFPEAGKVRVEEFVNAFDYGDPTPSQDERVACRVEQAAHPFMQQRNVMRIAMRTAAVGRAAGTPLRLTILLDNSGSMDRADRAESVQRAFGLLAAQLNEQDEVTLIGFARTPRLLREDVRGDQAGELLDVIARTPSEGGTNLEEALRLGTEKALENHLAGAQNRIILLTDGAANLGDAEPERLARMVEDLRQRGVAFDACGVGADGLNDTILEALTRKGDGRYYFLDRPEDADEGFAKQIAGALRPAAKNVKVQVEFNPERVGHYALYGFEKHELKKEDFRDDSVDAAELAAEEAGVAVYHFQPLPDGEGDIGTVSVRFHDTATGEMVEQLWPIPYEANPSPVEEAEPSLRLAATAAFLGETLKGSAVGDLVDLAELGRWSRSLQTVYPQSERVGQLVQMIEKVRELSGR